MDGSYSLVVVGDIEPKLRFGQSMQEGDRVLAISENLGSVSIDVEDEFNVFIYTTGYDIEDLF